MIQGLAQLLIQQAYDSLGWNSSNRMNSNSIDMARTIVRSISVVRPKVDVTKAVSQLEQLKTDNLITALIAEKVCHRVLELLRKYKSDTAEQLLANPVFYGHVRRREMVTKHCDRLANELNEMGESLNIPIWAIKGLSTRKWYANPRLRDMGDIDVMVSSVDDAVLLTKILHQRGYIFERRELPWLKQDSVTGTLYGQFNLKFSELYGAPNIDIHFGGYSICHCGLHRIKHEDATAGLSYFSRQDNLPLIVGNAAGDYKISTKDLNDIFYCLSEENFNWDLALRDLSVLELASFFGLMLSDIRDSFCLSIAQEKQLEAILNRTKQEWPKPGTHLHWERRWLATVKHARKLGAKHSLGRSITTAVAAGRYYWKPLNLKIRQHKKNVSAAKVPALNPWTCLRLIPVELLPRLLEQNDDSPLRQSFLALSGETKLLSKKVLIVQTSFGDIIRTEIGDFLPTIYYDVSAQLVDFALLVK